MLLQYLVKYLAPCILKIITSGPVFRESHVNHSTGTPARQPSLTSASQTFPRFKCEVPYVMCYSTYQVAHRAVQLAGMTVDMERKCADTTGTVSVPYMAGDFQC